MNLVHATRMLARWLLPSCLLVRRPSDDDDRDLNRRTAERAHRVADRWQQAMEMQRALEWERRFWERHAADDHATG